MSHASKRLILILGGIVVLLVLAAVGVASFVKVHRFKPDLEAAASDALGMEVRVGGRLGIGLLPGLHATVKDGRIEDGRGAAVGSAKKLVLGIDLLPMLFGRLRFNRLELTQPMLSIERDSGGTFNAERLGKVVALLGSLDGARLSISEGTLRFTDRQSAKEIDVAGLALKAGRIRIPHPERGSAEGLKGVSLAGALACGRFRTKDFTVTDVKAAVVGKDGVFVLDPMTMRLFGGQAAGSLRADLSGAVRRYQIRCSLPRFRIEEFLATLSPKKAAEGAMDFSANLTMQGNTAGELVRSTSGKISLRGGNLTLIGNDIDGALAHFESTQSFNLVDVGAVFFAGPLGLAFTRGYGFASLFRGSGGNSEIRTLVSEWNVEGGIARAKDVALATHKNRIALQGGLDFVENRFADVTVAAVDAKGCARVRQVIRGPFGKPEVEKPRILISLAGPVLKLYRQTRGLFPAGPCEAFYSGSVAAPE